MDLTVYGLKKSGSNLLKEITAGDDSVTLKVSSEDFVVENVKEKDSFLVTVADNDVQSMRTVSPMAAVEITSFKSRDLTSRGSGNLTTDGTKYDFSDAAEYDNPCLKVYTDGGNNDAQYSNPAYDAFIDQAKATSVPEERMEAFHKAEDVLMGEDNVHAPIYFYTQKYMMDESIQGMYYTPLGYFFFGYTHR